MSHINQLCQSVCSQVRLAIWTTTAALVTGIAVGIFVAGMAVGYRQACSDFGIYDRTVDQNLLNYANKNGLLPSRATVPLK